MFTELAIKRAILGGWNPIDLKIKAQNYAILNSKHEVRDEISLDGNRKTTTAREMIELNDLWNLYVSEICLLDKNFWRCLGKVEKWKDATENPHLGRNQQPQDEYMFHWHSLIDHLAQDKSIEEFFKSLLKE